MTTTWILVASATTAAIYFIDGNPAIQSHPVLQEVARFSHEENRKREHEIKSDRMGAHHGKGTGSGTFVDSSFNNPKQTEAEAFSRKLVAALQDGYEHKHYTSLVLVAPDHFYGILHEELSSHLSSLVTQVIQKDYTQLTQEELLAQLLKLLP